MSALIAGASVGVASLGYGIYKDAHQASEAHDIEAANKRPTETVDPLYQQNINTAQQMAQQGIPQEVINRQMNGINQNQAAAIANLNNNGRNGSAAGIVRAGDNAIANLNAQDAAARNKNTLALIQQRGIKARADQNAWTYNYANKYSEQLAKSQALLGAANQTENNTINAAGQLAGGLAGVGYGGYNNPDGWQHTDSALNNAAQVGIGYANADMQNTTNGFNQWLAQHPQTIGG